MLLFACICIFGAYYIPKIISPVQAEREVYLEDITESRMRLIPEKSRDEVLSKLKSRSAVEPVQDIQSPTQVTE